MVSYWPLWKPIGGKMMEGDTPGIEFVPSWQLLCERARRYPLVAPNSLAHVLETSARGKRGQNQYAAIHPDSQIYGLCMHHL